jgi:hypothetical protein
VIGEECLDSEGLGCILPDGTQELRMNFRKGEGTPPAGPRRLGSLILDTSELLVDPTNTVLITASGQAAGAQLQLRYYGTPNPAIPGDDVTPEVIASEPVIPVPEAAWSLQLASGALGLIGLARLRRRH